MQCSCGLMAGHVGPHAEPPRVAYGYGTKSTFVSTQKKVKRG